MNCKHCGQPLSANTLDRCPNCSPGAHQPRMRTWSRVLSLIHFLVINTLIVLGLAFLVLLIAKAWLER